MSTTARAACVVSICRCCIFICHLAARNMPEVAVTARPMSITPMSSSMALKPPRLVVLEVSVDRLHGDIPGALRVVPADVDGDPLQPVGRRVVDDLRSEGEGGVADAGGL